jgi:hypothetical protein
MTYLQLPRHTIHPQALKMAEQFNTLTAVIQYPLAAHPRNILRGTYVPLTSQEDIELDEDEKKTKL